mmetsp:Transcript_25985/g.53611  ORF Transcript_25985/g.53611 Transcript_25985/m.53611 type:complete len:502 (-) Transcript_25985:168-1673(-)
MITPSRSFFPGFMAAVVVKLAPTLLLSQRLEGLKVSSLGSRVDSLSTNSQNADESQTSTSTGINPSGYYGVDHSFPIHRIEKFSNEKENDPFDSVSKRKFYRDFMQGCRTKYAPQEFLCDDTEVERLEMNLRQPASMRNYTFLGFQKVRAPEKLMELLTNFWNENSKNEITSETWNKGNTYTNHWSSPTMMLNIEDSSLTGGGERIRTAVWDESRTLLEEWAGVELSPSSLYGIRVYTEGAVLTPHVDRMPLVISAIINVAQDVDEHWPLEVYGHDGMAYNVTMDIGDMVFYESHSVIHGRPFPLVGRSYANVFVHFEPIGHTLSHGDEEYEDEESLEYLYQQAWARRQLKCEDIECQSRLDLNVYEKAPHYILPGSLEEGRWIQKHPKTRLSNKNLMVTSYNAHAAASIGDLDALMAMEELKPESIKKVDENGWTALHEAARGGHVDVVEYLLERGLDINQRTHKGKGGSPLWWAKKIHGDDHPVVKYLKEKGAKNLKPE